MITESKYCKICKLYSTCEKSKIYSCDDFMIFLYDTNKYAKSNFYLEEYYLRTNYYTSSKDNFSADKIPEYQPPELVSITTEKPRETCIIKRVLNLFGCD